MCQVYLAENDLVGNDERPVWRQIWRAVSLLPAKVCQQGKRALLQLL